MTKKPTKRASPKRQSRGALDIPDFLLVKNRKPAKKRARAVVPPPAPERARQVVPKVARDHEAPHTKAHARREARAAEARGRAADAERRRIARQEIAGSAPTPLRKPPQSGSRKREVYEAWLKGGDKIATKRAAKLGIKEGTTRSWFGAWRRQAAAEVGTGPGAPAAVRAHDGAIIDRHPRSDGKRRVVLGNDPEGGQGVVVTEGAEQSVVRWDNGNETVVVNSWLRDLGGGSEKHGPGMRRMTAALGAGGAEAMRQRTLREQEAMAAEVAGARPPTAAKETVREDHPAPKGAKRERVKSKRKSA